MRILHNEKQKDNVAKFFWDAAKIALAALVLGPIAKPEVLQPWYWPWGTCDLRICASRLLI